MRVCVSAIVCARTRACVRVCMLFPVMPARDVLLVSAHGDGLFRVCVRVCLCLCLCVPHLCARQWSFPRVRVCVCVCAVLNASSSPTAMVFAVCLCAAYNSRANYLLHVTVACRALLLYVDGLMRVTVS